MRSTQRGNSGLGLALLSALAFGGSGVAAKPLIDAGFAPLHVAFMRVAGAALVLLPVALRHRRLPRQRPGLLIGFGLLGIAGCQALYYVAISRIPVGIAILVEYLGPALLLGWVRFVQRRKVPWAAVVGVVLAVVGMCFVVRIWSGLTFAPLGLLCAFGAACCQVAYFVLADHRGTAKRAGPVGQERRAVGAPGGVAAAEGDPGTGVQAHADVAVPGSASAVTPAPARARAFGWSGGRGPRRTRLRAGTGPGAEHGSEPGQGPGRAPGPASDPVPEPFPEPFPDGDAQDGAPDPVAVIAYGLLVGAASLALVARPWEIAWTSLAHQVPLRHVEVPAILLVGWIVLVSTVVSYLTGVAAVRRLTPQVAAVVSCVEAVVATVLAWVLLDEHLGAAEIVGGALVLAGAFAAQTASSAARSTAETTPGPAAGEGTGTGTGPNVGAGERAGAGVGAGERSTAGVAVPPPRTAPASDTPSRTRPRT